MCGVYTTPPPPPPNDVAVGIYNQSVTRCHHRTAYFSSSRAFDYFAASLLVECVGVDIGQIAPYIININFKESDVSGFHHATIASTRGGALFPIALGAGHKYEVPTEQALQNLTAKIQSAKRGRSSIGYESNSIHRIRDPEDFVIEKWQLVPHRFTQSEKVDPTIPCQRKGDLDYR
ncbi:hypothetical protein AWENTII_002823 [Aspergillus wentii]